MNIKICAMLALTCLFGQLSLRAQGGSEPLVNLLTLDLKGNQVSGRIALPRGNTIFMGIRSTFWDGYFAFVEDRLVSNFPKPSLEGNLEFAVTAGDQVANLIYSFKFIRPDGMPIHGSVGFKGLPFERKLPAICERITSEVYTKPYNGEKVVQLAQWTILYKDGHAPDKIFLDLWIGLDPSTVSPPFEYSSQRAAGKGPPAFDQIVTFTATR